MSFPVFSTGSENTRSITWWSCALGYMVTLIIVPVVAAAAQTIATELLRGTGITRTIIGPPLQMAEYFVQVLTLSYLAAWIGAIISIPIVIWARASDMCGWLTAALTGVTLGALVMRLFFQVSTGDYLTSLALPSAFLGLTFWITVRLIHPAAFRPAPSTANEH